jgi:hypothetical protein
MQENQQPQTEVSTSQETSIEVTKTFEKSLFPTPLRCFSFDLNEEELNNFLALYNQHNNETGNVNIMGIDNPLVEKLRGLVYSTCKQLEEFEDKESQDLKRLPEILGSNVFFQQPQEHVPLHCYEHVPLILTFVLHTGQFPPSTYFADTRGGVQTIRQIVSNSLVSTSYGLRGRVGEIIVTPGYLQRYVETNLSDQAQVFLNVYVGFINY